MKKFNSEKWLSDSDILEGCLQLNDDFLDEVNDKFNKRFSKNTEDWKQANYDKCLDEVCARFEKLKAGVLNG